MAARTTQVAVEIVAVDEASPKIDKLTKKIDGLESDEARIIVTSNIERIDKQLSDALYTLHQLDGDEATVQARLVGGLEDDLIAAKKLFDQLDGQTGTVHLNTEGATTEVRDLGKSADSSRSALANMVGNTAQDLGQLGGVAGSAGVAIGQLAEYASDATLAGEGLSVALTNMIAVAGPIAALALSVQLVKTAVEGNNDATKVGADNQERWNKALKDGGDITANWVNQIGDVNKVMVDITHLPDLSPGFRDAGFSLGNFFKIWDTGQKQTADATKALELAGITTQDIADAATNGADAYERYVAGVKAAAAAGRINSDQALILVAAVDQQKTAFDKARVAKQEFDKVFKPREEAAGVGALNTQLDDYIKFLEGRHWEVAKEGQAKVNTQLEDYLRLLTQRGNEAVQEQQVADATDQHFRALAQLNTEAERVDRTRLLKQEETQARATASEYDALFGKLNEQADRLALQAAFARAQEQLADTKTTALEAQTIISDLDLAVARFGQAHGIPEPLVKEIIAKIDTGQLDDATKTVLGYQAPKPVVVPIVPKWASDALAQGATADQLERLSLNTTPASRAPAAGNVTIINPPGTPAATVDSLNTFLRRNGNV